MGASVYRGGDSVREASDFPLLYPGVYDAVMAHRPKFPWHQYATSPHSSQAFCLSAFVPLWSLPTADAVLDEFVHRALPGLPFRERHWTVKVEFECPAMVGEVGWSTVDAPTLREMILMPD